MATEFNAVKWLQLLDSGTDAGRLCWEPTSDSDVFQVELPHGFVEIIFHQGANPVLQVLNKEFTVLERYTPNALTYEAALVTGLFEKARRSAHSINENLNRVLADLEQQVSETHK